MPPKNPPLLRARSSHRARVPVAVVGGLAAAAVVAGCTGRSAPTPEPPSTQAVASATPSAGATPTPAVSPTSTSRPQPQAVTIAFAGDTTFHQITAVRLANDPATAVGPMSRVLAAADLAMVNLETAVTTRGNPVPKAFNFRAPPSAFDALRSAGVDVTTMANNHGMDYGLVGLHDSLAAAADKRFPVVGIGSDIDQAFKAYRTTIKGDRISIVGATDVIDADLVSSWTAGPGKPGLASAKLREHLLGVVRAERAWADTVVVYLHWGSELMSCPTAEQRTVASQLSDAGADIVIGSHAHVLLGAGYLGKTYVEYGLGNFVFYNARRATTAASGVLTLTVRGHDVLSARWSPAVIVGGAPRPLAGSVATSAVARWDALRGCTNLTATPG